MSDLREQVEKALAEIRPTLQADGGNVELISVAKMESYRFV